MDYYIRLLNAPDNFEQLKEMANSSQLTVEETKFVGDLNKLQRYACLRKCAAVVSSESDDLQAKTGHISVQKKSELHKCSLLILTFFHAFLVLLSALAEFGP